MRVTVELPRIQRRHAVTTGVLATTAASLWVFGAAQMSSAVAMPLHVACGIAIPGGVGWVTVLLLERRIRRDDVRVARQAQPEPVLRRHLVEGEIVR
jgi:hypothetical protein